MLALELVKDRKTKEPAREETAQIIEACYRRGLLVIGAGIFGNVLRILVPLTIAEEELELGLSILEDAMAEVAG
jgi:4-aminobutyrate aminotransferase/(S)-3-amino-2-methylpropionate transaminase